MTVVLPAPVASFRARRCSSGLASLFAACKMLQYTFPGDEMRRNLREPDDSLDGLDLTEEWPNVVKLVMAPMLQ